MKRFICLILAGIMLFCPFVCMIIDKETNAPIFIGTTMHID